MGKVFEFGHRKFISPTYAGDLEVGSSLYFDVDGVSTEFLIVHQGNPDSNVYDSSCDGTWCLAKDIYTLGAWRTNGTSGKYEGSTVDLYLNDTFLQLITITVQNSIKTVIIPYVDGTGTTGVLKTGANGLSTNVFLLSAEELGIHGASYQFNGDGAKLDYFPSGNSTQTIRIAYYNGTANQWYLRTPSTYANAVCFAINANGSTNTGLGVTSTTGYRPAFILPSDFNVTNYLTAS